MMMQWYQPHPYGVLPKGNRVMALQNAQASSSSLLVQQLSIGDEMKKRLGPLFAAPLASPHINDETQQLEVLYSFLEYLGAEELCALSATSTAWFAVAHVAEIWKRLYHALASPTYSGNHGKQQLLQFVNDWKTTVIRQFYGAPDSYVHQPMKFMGRALHNDSLFQAWMCTTMPPNYQLKKVGARRNGAGGASETASDAGSVMCPSEMSLGCGMGASHIAGECPTEEQISRLEIEHPELKTSTEKAMKLNEALPQYSSKFKKVQKVFRPTQQEFRDQFEAPNLPCVIQGVATEWKMFQELNNDYTNLGKKADLFFPHRNAKWNAKTATTAAPSFRCESLEMSAEGYVQYSTTQRDERPIYLFDAEFASYMDAGDMWQVPEFFDCDDLFGALGSERPKYRWLISGPTRGGSSFHVDPNFTSAWNACLTGRKRWLLFPPQHVPPGVYPSKDMRDVTTPVSISEWFLNYYEESVRKLAPVGYEVICDPGEIMYVPYGWWHTVINLGDSVALTQNYVSKCNLPKVLRFLKHMPNSISGIDEDVDDVDEAALLRKRQGFFDKFVHALQQHPEKISAEELDAVMETIDQEEDVRKKKRMEREQRQKIDFNNADESGADGFTFAF